MKRCVLVLATCLVALAWFANAVGAAEFYWCVGSEGKQRFRWDALAENTVHFGFVPEFFPDSYKARLQEAVSAWNRNPGTIRISLAPDDAYATVPGRKQRETEPLPKWNDRQNANSGRNRIRRRVALC